MRSGSYGCRMSLRASGFIWQARALAKRLLAVWNDSSTVSIWHCIRINCVSDVSAPHTGRPYCHKGIISCLIMMILQSLSSLLFGPRSHSNLAALAFSFIHRRVTWKLRVIFSTPTMRLTTVIRVELLA